MRKLIALGAGALASAGVCMGLFGSAVATAAPDVVGKTYDEASSALSDAGMTAKVATTVGDQADKGSCVVTSATNAPFVGGTDASHVSNTMLLNLNCYAAVASTTPGVAAGDQTAEAQAVKNAVAASQAQSEAGVTASNQR